jgi:hypothetical protein
MSEGMKKSTGKAQESTGDPLLYLAAMGGKDRPIILLTDVFIETLNSTS